MGDKADMISVFSSYLDTSELEIKAWAITLKDRMSGGEFLVKIRRDDEQAKAFFGIVTDDDGDLGRFEYKRNIPVAEIRRFDHSYRSRYDIAKGTHCQNRYLIEPMTVSDPVIRPERIVYSGRFSMNYKVIETTIESHDKCLMAGHRIAQYFQREFGYDFVQHDGIHETDTDMRCLLWCFEDVTRYWKTTYHVHNACCFRMRRYTSGRSAYALQWIWFHPFLRRKGLLKEAWPAMVGDYGDFIPEPPLSHAMARFLVKHGTDRQKEFGKAYI